MFTRTERSTGGGGAWRSGRGYSGGKLKSLLVVGDGSLDKGLHSSMFLVLGMCVFFHNKIKLVCFRWEYIQTQLCVVFCLVGVVWCDVVVVSEACCIFVSFLLHQAHILIGSYF